MKRGTKFKCKENQIHDKYSNNFKIYNKDTEVVELPFRIANQQKSKQLDANWQIILPSQWPY